MPSTHHIATQVHGRYLVDSPGGADPLPLLVGFHGYGERADTMLEVLRGIRGERRWRLVSVQALHPFYTRRNEVVGSWMTREDRELAIADNIAYVSAVVAAVQRGHPALQTLVYAGFSQGVAMAYRAAAFAAAPAAGVPAPAGAIVLAGDLPPDVAPHAATLPPLLIGRGTQDEWYTAGKAAADLEVLTASRRAPLVHVFEGGHEWHASFVTAAGMFLDQVADARTGS